jgi:hypothetical protein
MSIFVIGIVFTIVASLMFLQHEFTGRWIVLHKDFGRLLFGWVNAIQIYVFNKLYQKLALRLTENENHKT